MSLFGLHRRWRHALVGNLTVLEMTFGDSLHQLGEVSARMQDTAGVFA